MYRNFTLIWAFKFQPKSTKEQLILIWIQLMVQNVGKKAAKRILLQRLLQINLQQFNFSKISVLVEVFCNQTQLMIFCNYDGIFGQQIQNPIKCLSPFIENLRLIEKNQKMISQYKNLKKDNEQNNYIIKARPLIQKISSQMASMPILKSLTINHQSRDTFFSKPSALNLQQKIQNNFQSIINTQNIIPFRQQSIIKNKENILPISDAASFSSLEAKKTFIYPNAHKRQVRQIESNTIIASKNFDKDTAQKLPSLSPKISSKLPLRHKQNSETIGKQKQIDQTVFKQQQFERRQRQLKTFFHRFVIPIRDFHIENASEQFLNFQRSNYKLWDQIQKGITTVQRFCEKYEIRNCSIELKKLLTFIKSQKLKNSTSKCFLETKYKTHQILDFLQDGEDISQENQHKSGIRFYGTKGKYRAIVKIQANVKRWLAELRFKKVKSMIKQIIIIQREYRVHRAYNQTKAKIFQRRLEKMKRYNLRQINFQQNYRHKQLTCSSKYQIHISCHSVSQWQRLSTERFIQKQNSQICRIFRVATNSTIQTRVIYISAVPISQEILSYYFKLFEIGGKKQLRDRIYIISPEIQSGKFSQTFSLTKSLFFSSQTLNRIKKLIKGSYGYIVPSYPSNDNILLSDQLDFPVYSSHPQPLLHLQTKAGNKEIIKHLEKKLQLSQAQEAPICILPYSIDIYSKSVFLSELTSIILRNPKFSKWVLKIDDEINSRGIAHIDISKILTKSHLQSLRTENPQKSVNQKQKLYNILQQSIFNNERDSITILDKKLYKTQKQYLGHYFSKGGIIQPAISNFQQQLQNICYAVEVEPDNTWRIISNYEKLTVKKKATACYFAPIKKESPNQVQSIVQYLLKRKLYGFFNIEFNKVIQKKHFEGKTSTLLCSSQTNCYFSGIQCSLNEYCSASFLHSFIGSSSYALYLPIIDHPSIKQLRMQTFFHLCRLQNISFDIGRKTGNIFIFVDGLESGCIGMMTFNQISKQDTFVCASQVLDFFGSKLTPNTVKNTPCSFVQARNSINCCIKKTIKRSSCSKISKQTDYI